MSTTTPIGALHGAAATGAAPTAGTAPAGRTQDPRFQELLERLQRLAAGSADRPQAPDDDPTDQVEDLQQSLRAADDSFRTAMDLRRQLEAAFQRHQR